MAPRASQGLPHLSETHELTAAALAALYRQGLLSPVDVLEAALARSAEVQERLNPFRLFDATAARAAAIASERRWQDGAPLSPLDGVPIAVKDNHAVAGQAKASGSRSQAHRPPETEDALHIARLRAGGAILFARTNMPDLGWKGVNDSPLSGVTRNPWNPALTPGGSSGGSAVAVATGCAPIATGGDGGGSVRIPAAFTGVFGLKPTTGRIPGLYDSPAGDLVAPGPLTRSVADAAAALAVMCAPDPRDPIAAALRLPDFPAETQRGVRGLRVAVSANCGFARIDPERVAPLREAAAALEAEGAIVELRDPPLWDARASFAQIWEAAYASAVLALPGAAMAQLDPGLIEAARRGMMLSAAVERQAQQERNRLMQACIGFFQGYDLLLTPTMPIAPFPVGVDTPNAEQFRDWYDWTPYTWVFNMTRMPAASWPWDLDEAGLPQGVQVVATHFREDLVLRACAVLEAALPCEVVEDRLWRT